jgi:urease accessory protein
MRVPLAEVGRRGRMELAFRLQDGRTILQDAYCEVPFKVTRVLAGSSPLAHVILMHSTAGLFGGDDLECSIHVGRGARVRITQQSATKIHPSEDRPAVQRLKVSVEEDAELHLHMEAIIPFSDSRLHQTTQLDVAHGGKLSYWEGFMTGRIGHGESWKFRELASETRLISNGGLVYLDRFHLTPDFPGRSTWTLGEANYTGIGLFVGKDARTAAAELHQAMPDAGVDALGDQVTVVRVVASTGPDFHQARERFCRHSHISS